MMPCQLFFFLQIISKPNEHHNIKDTSGKRTDDLKRKNSLENNKSPVKKVKGRSDKMRVAISSPESKGHVSYCNHFVSVVRHC